MECLKIRKLYDSERKLIVLLLSGSNLDFKILDFLSDTDVTDLDDGCMGSIEFIRENVHREFGLAILNAVTYDIDNRKVMLELSVDKEGCLYQLDAFTEDFLPLKAPLGVNLKIDDFHSPPIFE